MKDQGKGHKRLIYNGTCILLYQSVQLHATHPYMYNAKPNLRVLRAGELGR